MKVRVLPSSHANPQEEQFLTSYLVNDRVAVDAGCLGLGLDPRRQGAVDHVFLSHTHADHVFSLPMFLENFHSARAKTASGAPTVYGSPEVLESLRRDMFNDRVWPDLSRLSIGAQPYVKFVTLIPETPVEVAGLRVTPVSVNHVVPTTGLIIDDGAAAVAIPSDTGPTERIWELARQIPHLKAVFLECTFADDQVELAGITGHLTPSLFAREAAKLDREVTLVAVHLRAHQRRRIAEEIGALGLKGLTLGCGGTEYSF